jgi:UDP-N-acetylglucosamine 2-epimerase (non-hydrolysing)
MRGKILSFFEITPDYDLNIMQMAQNLFQLTADIITEFKTGVEKIVMHL